MIKFNINFLLLLLISLVSFSQTPPYYNLIPTGGSNIFPFSANSATGKKVQWVVAANEFALPTPAPAGHNITHIWFYANSAGNATYTNLTIRLANVPTTTFISTGAFYSGPMTTVLMQNTTLNPSGSGTWISIPLTTNFLYDPSQNLIVEVSQCGYTGTGFSLLQTGLGAAPNYRRQYSDASSPCGVTPLATGGDLNVAGIGLTLIPSTPCSGQPTGGTTVAAPTNPCPGTPVLLTLNGATLGGNLTYQWLLSSTGNPGTWSPITGATTAGYNYTPVTGSTNYFRCIVTCTNSSLFDTSVVVGPVTTQPWSPTSPCYCGTSTATSNLNGDILNFTMATLNNTTDCLNPLTGSQGTGTGTPSQRADFTSIAAPVIYAGLNQNFSMTVGSCGTSSNYGAKVYIDYNHNSVFTDPGEEVYFSGTTAFTVVPSTVLNGTLAVPPINPGIVEPGLTRMRVIAQLSGHTTPTTITPCGSYTQGETEDYLVNIIPPSPYDPGVVAITSPSGNCFTATSLLTVQLRNFGSNPIDLSVNPVTVNLHVNGPNGLNTYNVTVSTGLLTPYGASGVTAIFSGPNAVNLYAGGIYSINTTLSISGLTNGNLFNDSLQTPVIKENYRPTPGAPYQLCQYSSIPFGQGLSVSGCSAPIFGVDSVIFTINPNIIDNVGATGTGTALNLPANCSNIYAGALGNAVLPTLPPGAYFTQPGELEVTNMSSSFRTEVRFILYGNAPVGPDLYAGCPTGYNVGANNLNIGGLSVGTAALFSNKRNITPAQLSAMYGGNGTVNLGYWETWNDLPAASDATFNVSGPTTAKLKFYYAYVPAGFNWYTVPSGPNPSLYNSTPFNPLVTTGSGISNSNTTGTYTFYAACSSSPTCRVPVELQINPTPLAVQDTLSKCEYAVSSNAAIFDLTTMDASVSNNNVAASVEYYLDEPLFSQVPLPMDDTSSTNFIYSKVFYPATGCFSKDSLLLQVNSLPEFPSPVLTGFTCAPNSIDVANLIDPFSTTPLGTDTLYYEDPAYTIPHPNPHTVGVADTVYMVFATNTTPICSDTAVAYIDIIPANNYLSGQVLTPSIFSNAGSYSCVSTTLMDGMSDTIRTTTDCRRVASVTDVVNGTSLGTVSACLDIAPSTPFYNGQPYVNRAYTITPTTNDTGYVCLYYLDQDFQDYNADAFFTGWPLLPTAATMPANMQNVAVTKVSNGALGSLGSVPTAIPNSAINVSYDPATTVWTVCLPAEGFSHFYLHAQNPGNAPLPVTLLSFTGRSVKGSAELNWITSMERNNSHFILERSREGKNFTPLSDKIVSQAVNGNSDVALNYNYTDSKPFEGHNYYRLQQHDIDGNSSYSAVVNVYFGNETMVTVYPNPVHNLLTLEVNTPKATPAQVKITDATGRVVRVTDMQLQAGSNQTQIDLQSLAYGVYMLNISNGKGLNYSQSVRKN